jgi:tetratricopeptide (TPR) repeat protein
MTGEEFYELAANAVKRKKYKQAKGYFMKALGKDPEYVEARRGLRAVAMKEYGGKAFPAVMSGLSDLIQVFVCKLKKNNDDGLVAGQKFLNACPVHSWTLKQMITFCELQEYPKSQSYFYGVLAELNPEDADLVIEAADFLANSGELELYEKAVGMMAQLCKAFPDDSDLAAERNRIDAIKMLNKVENAKTQADVLKDKDAAKKMEEESQQIKTADDLEKAITRALEREKAEPESARAREVLADLYSRKGDYPLAIQKFEESIELDPNNQNVQARLGDIRIKQVAEQVSSMEKRTDQLSGAEKDDHVARIKGKKKDLQDLKLSEYGRRLKINPNDLKTRFELGSLFFSARAFDKAIQQFQRSVQDARLSFRSSTYLGHCYKHKKLYDMAIKEFVGATKKAGASASDRLSAQYEAAICYEADGKSSEALDLFKAILEKDFGFKDVAARVEALQQ